MPLLEHSFKQPLIEQSGPENPILQVHKPVSKLQIPFYEQSLRHYLRPQLGP